MSALTGIMRRTKEESEQTRRQILRAARREFFLHGVTRTTMERIATAAGVTRGAVYWHFENKRDLFNAMLAQFGDDAKLLAGGHSLLPMMKMRFAQPAHLIDLGKIPELRGVREEGGTIRIGAMTTENELIWSKLLQDKCPLLVEGARQISDPQVRYKGTIGGDIAHGDPGNDHPALMLAVGASFVLRSKTRERTVPADGFFVGTYDTQMKPDEIMPHTAYRVWQQCKALGVNKR